VTDHPRVVVGIDPGRAKCGLAAVSRDGVLARAVVSAGEIGVEAAEFARRHRAALLVLGSRTGSDEVRRALDMAGIQLPIVVVEEHMSTLQARRRYWSENPPGCLMRLVPTGMREPPEPYDDWAAALLAERYLETNDNDDARR
jgi:RNase H-fold protein (predicted Holliday junction resolvase)